MGVIAGYVDAGMVVEVTYADVAGMREKLSVGNYQLAVISFISLWLCFPSGAEAGWFVPENRIAWQAWHDGENTASLAHWDHSSKGMFGRGTVLMRMGHLRAAEQAFRQALDGAVGVKPEIIASFWYNLGDCLYAEGALNEARKAWRQTLQYNPEHAKAAHNLRIVGDVLKHQRMQPKYANATVRKKKKQTHGDKRQSENGFPVSRKNNKARKKEQGGDSGRVKNVRQAVREVNDVRDSMGVFLRHRLAEKAIRTLPSRRGNPW